MKPVLKPHYRWSWELKRPIFVSLRDRRLVGKTVVVGYDCGPFLDLIH